MNTDESSHALIVATRPPFPPSDGARIRVRAILDGLAAEHKVYFLLVTAASITETERDYLSRVCEEYQIVRLNPFSQLLRVALGLLRSRPAQVSLFYSGKAQRAAREMSANCDFAVAVTVRAASTVGAAELPTLLDFVDLISDSYASIASVEKWGIRRWFYALEARLMNKCEVEAAQKADAVSLISRRDVEGQRLDAPASWLPNPATVRLNRAISRHTIPYLLFVGRLSYPPNRQALSWFVDHVLDDLPENVELWVAGEEGGMKNRALREHARVRFLGFVPDLDGAVERALAVLAPMRSGGGMQNKVLDGFRNAVPVLGSPLAFSAFRDLDTDSPWMEAEAPSEYKEAVESLLLHPNRRLELGAQGAAFAERHLSPRSFASRLTELTLPLLDRTQDEC